MSKITKLTILAATIGNLLHAQSVATDSGPKFSIAGQEAELRTFLAEVQNEYSIRFNLDQKVLKGAVNFFLPFPGGNGRSCATCHVPENGFSLSPAPAEARWQRLQRVRKILPNADDPLFQSIDADDGNADFTLLRTGC